MSLVDDSVGNLTIKISCAHPQALVLNPTLGVHIFTIFGSVAVASLSSTRTSQAGEFREPFFAKMRLVATAVSHDAILETNCM